MHDLNTWFQSLYFTHNEPNGYDWDLNTTMIVAMLIATSTSNGCVIRIIGFRKRLSLCVWDKLMFWVHRIKSIVEVANNTLFSLRLAAFHLLSTSIAMRIFAAFYFLRKDSLRFYRCEWDRRCYFYHKSVTIN